LIAFSIALIEDASNGWIVSRRASGAVVVDLDAIEQRRAGASGAHRAELPDGRVVGLAHTLPRIVDEIVDQRHCRKNVAIAGGG
jgi:hypothetical protein